MTSSRLGRWWRALFSERPLRALFVGNSLTFFSSPAAEGAVVLNDLPGLLGRMAAARHRRRLEAGRVSHPGASLEDHLESGLFEAELKKRAWDFVILQENSERVPARDARRLHTKIQAAGARTALFETGSALGGVYRELAGELGARLIPVGEAWREAIKVRPRLRLLMRDRVHPSPAGAYLTACVFYSCFYEGGVVSSDDDFYAVEELRRAHVRVDGASPALSADDLEFLRLTAARV